MTDNEFKNLLARVLDVANSDVLEDSILIEDVPNLDSLRFLQMMNELEANAGISLSPEDLMDVETIGDLVTTLHDIKTGS